MPRREFPHVSHFRDRHGQLRWRWRKNGRTVSLGTGYGSPEFLRKLAEAQQGDGKPTGKSEERSSSRYATGSLSAVINSWLRCPAFICLGESTQKNYRRLAERLREELGRTQVASFRASDIKALMAERRHTPEAANTLLRILRLLLDHAMELDLVEVNPSRSVAKYTGDGDGFHTWTEDEITMFQARHPEGSIADLAMCLMLYTGASRVDAALIGPMNRKRTSSGDRIQYRRKKMQGRSGMLIDIPLHPELARRLDGLQADGRGTYLQTQYGKPRSAAGLGNAMRRWCDAAGLVECSSHGLRKAIARRLVEAGATPHEVMAVTGHKTLAEAQRYAEAFERRCAADRAMRKQRDASSSADTAIKKRSDDG